ncbi:DUF397 domain-containing protein [Streptomyces sp. 7R007]
MISNELAWFKSSYSGNEGEACLEIAPTPTTIHIRDSKHPHPDSASPTLSVTPTTWTAFLRTVR